MCANCGHTEKHIRISGCTHQIERLFAEDDKFCSCKNFVSCIDKEAS